MMVFLLKRMSESVINQFNYFKVHTQFSICEGTIKIDDLKNFCKDNKIRSIGISDTNNLCGALEFSEEISKSGAQPIIGTQINFKLKDESGLMPIIAKNSEGYKSIVELSSQPYLNFTDSLLEPSINIDELFNKKDVIVLSGSISGLVGKLFIKGKIKEIETLYEIFKEKFKDNFYIEIQRHNDLNEKDFEKFNLNLSNKLNIPIIASQEVFYIDKGMYEAHDALICIKNKSYVNDKNRIRYSGEHYLKSNEQIINLFSDIPEALKNNFNLSYKCSFRPISSKPVLPNISSKSGEEPDYTLKKLSIDGLKEKFIKVFKMNETNLKTNIKFKNYLQRLDHELQIIIKMQYSSYFLIVSDYIKWAKKNDIPVGPGRGSGAGSLVAWCLSITDLDPIKYNLIFERFLNPDRISMPDFDIDFCEEKRDKLFEYLNSKYKDSVAHIITFGKLKARMVIRDVGRVIGLSYGFVDNISKMIPFDPSRPKNLTQCINDEPRLQKLIKEDKRVKKLIDLSLKLEGLNRNVATHAAGVVIADKKLTDTVPLYKDHTANFLLPSTQFDMHSAEKAGLIKFDFLGLKTLTVINKTEKIIKNKRKDFCIENIDYDDPKVFDLLSTGKTTGLFQLESAGMREALINMKPNLLEDIIALVALYRPGPMANISIYNDCKNRKSEPDYLHPLLEDILKTTYGVIIYQEQVMQIAQKLSGFTAGEADILRRAMGKKKRSELEKQKKNFIEGAVKNGISRDVAAGIFLKIEPFAEYGFNKSHAAAYGIIAYQTAFLKTYYPYDFFSASMTMEISNQKKLSEFYEELKTMNVNIIRPDINNCFADFKAEENNFYYALGSIKSVGFEAVSNIVSEREKGKFKSLNDFINRVNSKDINKLQLEGLVKAGAFDSLNKNRASIFQSIPNLIQRNKSIVDNKSINQIDLFNDAEIKENTLLTDIEDWNFEDRLSREFESVGFFISDHPLNQFKDLFNDYKISNFIKFSEDENIKETNLASTLLKIQEKKTSKGNSYAIIKLSDLSSVYELFIFSDLLELNRSILKEGSSLMLTITKNISDPNNRLKRFNVKKIVSIKEIYKKPITKVEFTIYDKKDIKTLSKFFNKNGSTEVTIVLNEKNSKKFFFKLQNKRFLDRKSINLIKNDGIEALIQ